MRAISFDAHIVQFYGACTTTEPAILVMEYMRVRQSDLHASNAHSRCDKRPSPFTWAQPQLCVCDVVVWCNAMIVITRACEKQPDECGPWFPDVTRDRAGRRPAQRHPE